MIPFVTYLLVVNAVSFAAFAFDFLLCSRFPAVDDSAANSLVMDAFMIAGGAVGALLAMFVFMRSIHRHRISKDNVAWWFLALVCLVVWAMVAGVVTGLLQIDPARALGTAVGILDQKSYAAKPRSLRYCMGLL